MRCIMRWKNRKQRTVNREVRSGRNESRPGARAVFVAMMPMQTVALLAGCAHVENYWREDGPAKTVVWESVSEQDIRAHAPASAQRERGWNEMTVASESGVVAHGPLWFEDPFVDKGSGRTPLDERNTGRNEYALSWEDYVAMPYCLARHTLNWLGWPASAVVTPPWTEMESDGRLSAQALGYDHDAERRSASK